MAKYSLLIDKHVEYIRCLDEQKESLDYWLSEHLRLSGVYWGLTALDLLGKKEVLDRHATIEYVKSCLHKNGMINHA